MLLIVAYIQNLKLVNQGQTVLRSEAIDKKEKRDNHTDRPIKTGYSTSLIQEQNM